MLDISRCKVPTLATLRRLIDRLASLKYNQLQLYTEHTFAYRRHPTVWAGQSPLTAAQVRELDRYCRDRGIELVPNQNSLGHMERWLRHPRYAPLAEATGPWKSPFGDVRTVKATLCPSDPRAIRLMAELYRELLPNFSSGFFNVGGDEPFELGQGRSRAACARRGRGRVYLDWIRKLHGLVRRHDRRMMIWGDIVAEHPELVRQLPRDLILLEWGYEADHPFDARCAAYRRAGLTFYICPGTSSWCSFAGRTSNARANLLAAARAGVRHGAEGYVVTDWGDFGHRQHLPVSFAPIVLGAAAAWNAAAADRLDVAAATSAWMFDDMTGRAALPWLELGRAGEVVKQQPRNKTIWFACMQAKLDSPDAVRGLDASAPARARKCLQRARRLARAGRVNRKGQRDAAIVASELAHTLDVLEHATNRADVMLALQRGGDVRSRCAELARDIRRIVAEHARLWRVRNRPGGLRESLGYYRSLLTEYQRIARGSARSTRAKT